MTNTWNLALSLILTLACLNSFAEASKEASSAHESGAKHESSDLHNGANLNLFPPPKADLSKSARPAKPELVEPSYRAQIQGEGVTLKWSLVPTATAYHLQLATDPNFKWLIVNEEMLGTNSYSVKGLQKGKHYFWRVAALKGDNLPGYFKGWYSLSTFETRE